MKSSLKIVWKAKIAFLISETLPFFLKQKYILFLETYLFKILKNLIASSFFFLPRQTLKTIDMPQQKPEMLHWLNLQIESLKMVIWLIVCCFSVSDKHGQTSNVIWLSTTWLLIFRLGVANRRSLFTKPASICIEIRFNIMKIDIIFHGYKYLYPNPGSYTGRILFANESKIIRTCFVTL